MASFFAAVVSFLVFAAAFASGNTVTFISLDQGRRIIKFTPNEGLDEIPDLPVGGFQTVTVQIPQGWAGMLYSYPEGDYRDGGMLAEFTFQGFEGKTTFDVSAIDHPEDIYGVHLLYPASQKDKVVKDPVAGCVVFPCKDAYYDNDPHHDQSHLVPETDFFCTLGTAAGTRSNSTTADGEEIPPSRRSWRGAKLGRRRQ